VPETLLDDPWVHASAQRQCRVGVTQVVQADDRQPGVAGLLGEVVAEQLRVQGCAVDPADHQVLVGIAGAER
jgi:hypothetical protein